MKPPKLDAVLQLVLVDLHLFADMMLLVTLELVTLWNPWDLNDAMNNQAFLLSKKHVQ